MEPDQIRRRLERLERDSHVPFDFSSMVMTLRHLEHEVKLLRKRASAAERKLAKLTKAKR